MAQIICLGSGRWLKQAARTQWMLAHLNKSHDILYFQPSPSLLSRDPKKQDHKKEGRHPQANITVYTLPPTFQITDDKHPRLLSHNVKKLTEFIQEKAAKANFYNPLLWVCSPVYVGLLDTLEYKGVVYDCYQDWPQFDIHWESYLANRADVLFAASPGLVDHLAPCNRNIALIPNGSNSRLYAKVEDLTLQVPAPLLKIRAPLFGYLGDVTAETDLRPVFRAAKAHTAWSFVFAGRCSKYNSLAQAIHKLPNVHFIGKVSPLDLPGYAAQFDVLFDLLSTDDPDEDVVPSRIYEYLIVGKPIAAMYPLRFAPVFSDVIYGAHSPKEFVDACYQALLENSSWAPATRKQYGYDAAWENRAHEAERILESNGLL